MTLRPIIAMMALILGLAACSPSGQISGGSGGVPAASGPAKGLSLGDSRADVEAVLGLPGPQVRDPANPQRLCVSYPYQGPDGATLYAHAVYLGDVLAAIGDGNTAPCAP